MKRTLSSCRGLADEDGLHERLHEHNGEKTHQQNHKTLQVERKSLAIHAHVVLARRRCVRVRVLLLHVLQALLLLQVCVALDPPPTMTVSNKQAMSTTTAATSSSNTAADFVLDATFYDNKCNPCIARSDYYMVVVAHGTLDDPFWQQTQAAMQQASRDTGIALDFDLYDPNVYVTQEDIWAHMATTIRKFSTLQETQKDHTNDNNNNRRRFLKNHFQDERVPDALIVTLPSSPVHVAVKMALQAGIPVFGFHSGYTVAQHLGVLGFVAQDEQVAGQMVAQEIWNRLQEEMEAEGNAEEELESNLELAQAQEEMILLSLELNNGSTLVYHGNHQVTVSKNSNRQYDQNHPKKVVFINHNDQDWNLMERYRGLQLAFLQNDQVQVSQIVVDPTNVVEMVQILKEQVFLYQEMPEDEEEAESTTTSYTNCADNKQPPRPLYDYVVLGGPEMVAIAVSALQEARDTRPASTNNNHNCNSTTATTSTSTSETKLVAFGMDAPLVQAIVAGQLAFTAAPQPYIESVFVVVMAATFVTTGKKLALPAPQKIVEEETVDKDSTTTTTTTTNTNTTTTSKNIAATQNLNHLYLSGPVLITQDNVPTDTLQTCRDQAFPVCDPETGRPYFNPNNSNNNNNLQSSSTQDTTAATTEQLVLDIGQQSCNTGSACLPRKVIRIGGVLHGITTDVFWDPVFAAAQQAARDVGIATLEMERLEAQESPDIVFAKMAARITTLCQSGVDGIFVTIPDDVVLDSIRLCQSLNIPVISINAGADKSKEMGLLHHIGQSKYIVYCGYPLCRSAAGPVYFGRMSQLVAHSFSVLACLLAS